MNAATAPLETPRWRLYEGGTGERLSHAALVARAREADVVVFGEQHGHGAARPLQRMLLRALAEGDRPTVLALEFLERDAQGVADRWMRGDATDAALAKAAPGAAARGAPHAHLLSLARSLDVPVVAANAPRRLVTAWRKSEATYGEYLASLPEEQRAWMPRETSIPEDAYYERFLALMGGDHGAPFFRAQALWDDAMAESVADARAREGDPRVLLIAGVFHVASGGGTTTKIVARRPDDRVLTIVMAPSSGDALALPADDRDAGDAIVVVAAPPAAKEDAPPAHPVHPSP
jgi:uncharacterized iron-regulated protein